MKFIIKDWAGNTCFDDKEFSSFDDGEEFLSEKLDDEYHVTFKEYEILDEENYFDQAEAFYTVCVLWHAGQNSKLYELSCRIDFRPGMGWSESQVEQENEFFSMFEEKRDDLEYMEKFVDELEHYFENRED